MKATAAQLAGTEHIPASQVPCGHCAGHGYVHLGQPFARTHVLVSSGWEDTMVIFKRHTDGVKLTTLHQRLAELLRFGLVEKRRSGRGVQWRRK